MNAGDQPVALYTRQSGSGSSNLTRYFHLDHQGSIESVTNADGSLYVRESFNAFGGRRDPTTWSGGVPSGDATLIGNLSRRGYTFHESLGSASLIHMNGRVMDPLIGRFLSADPFIPEIDNTQSWNRYSYVNNNPLSYVDPSGYFLKKLFRGIKKLFKNRIFRAVVGVALAIAVPHLAIFKGHAILGSIAGGAAGGAASAGNLRGAFLGGLSGGLFYGAGHLAATRNLGSIGQAVAHATAWCVTSVAGGGQCGAGALGAGFANLVGSRLPDFHTEFSNAIRNGVIGGFAARVGGGDFGYGFVNGVAGYAFNELRHLLIERQSRNIFRISYGEELADEVQIDVVGRRLATKMYFGAVRADEGMSWVERVFRILGGFKPAPLGAAVKGSLTSLSEAEQRVFRTGSYGTVEERFAATGAGIINTVAAVNRPAFEELSR